jgi:hypothetical protein
MGGGRSLGDGPLDCRAAALPYDNRKARKIMQVALKLAVLVCVLMTMLSSNAAAQHQPAFNCPDNGTTEVASNASGTTDKVLTLYPSSSSDDDFLLEVYIQDGENVQVIDTVVYDGTGNPSVTVPPGARARVRDPQDNDTKGPKGTHTYT